MSGGRQKRELKDFTTTHLEVRRTARVIMLGDPSPSVRQVWIACHGYGQLAADFAVQLSALHSLERLVLAPEALNRFYLEDHGGAHGPDHPVGATWMTREERIQEIDDYCAYLDAVYDMALDRLTSAPVVIALGFSQGASTASRWAARGTRPVNHVVLWGAGLAAELEPRPRLFGDASLTLVAGTRDRNVSAGAVASERARLDGAGLAHAVEQFEGGHRLDDQTLLRLADRFA